MGGENRSLPDIVVIENYFKVTNMRIGTDASFVVCRDEGYAVIDFKEKTLFPNGRDKGLDKNAKVRLTISNPSRWKNGRSCFKTKSQKNSDDPFPIYFFNEEITFNNVYMIYLENKDGVNGYADLDNCPIEMNNPDERDFVNLAELLHTYCGLN